MTEGKRFTQISFSELSGAGWLLVIGTVIFALGGSFVLFAATAVYAQRLGGAAKVLIVVPFVMGLLFFIVGRKVLSAAGHPILRSEQHDTAFNPYQLDTEPIEQD